MHIEKCKKQKPFYFTVSVFSLLCQKLRPKGIWTGECCHVGVARVKIVAASSDLKFFKMFLINDRCFGISVQNNVGTE